MMLEYIVKKEYTIYIYFINIILCSVNGLNLFQINKKEDSVSYFDILTYKPKNSKENNIQVLNKNVADEVNCKNRYCKQTEDCCTNYQCEKIVLNINKSVCAPKMKRKDDKSLTGNNKNSNLTCYINNKYLTKNKTDKLHERYEKVNEINNNNNKYLSKNFFDGAKSQLSEQKVYIFTWNNDTFYLDKKNNSDKSYELEKYFKVNSSQIESVKNLYSLFLKYQINYINLDHTIYESNTLTFDEYNITNEKNVINQDKYSESIRLELYKIIKEKGYEMLNAFVSAQIKINEILNYIRNNNKRFKRSQVDHIEAILNYIKKATRDLNHKLHKTDFTFKQCLNNMKSSLDNFVTKRNRLHKDYFLTEKNALKKLDKMENEIKDTIDKEIENFKLKEVESNKNSQKRSAFKTKMENALKKLKNLILRFYKRTRDALERYRNTLAGVDLDATSKKGLLDALSRIY
ncbi:uncharacterized protein LOC142325627 isoform X2 [Lycorma delicatula]|uniref:uncharacterized protein LOC142325627 isoform X2 n=1 Tax=Lycorma delicatula TaxID=130591 RepID=UPI003F5181D9